MTYSVFGGTLNPAQPNTRIWTSVYRNLGFLGEMTSWPLTWKCYVISKLSLRQLMYT